jgi:3-methyladenine DNA glycosylase/8-oxoguanine DNA glycosylase
MLFADQVATRIVRPTAPFHFDGTVHKPSHFPAGNVCYEPGFYWQTLRFRNRCLGLRLKDLGTRARPRVEVALFAPKPLPAALVDAAVAEIAFRFDLYTPLAEFISALRNDALLAPILRRWGGMRMSCAYSLYEYLVVAIALQNTTVLRSAQMLEALFQRFGTRMHFDGRELHCFWLPRTLCRGSEAELCALKLGYRAKSLLRLAQAFAADEAGELDLRAADPGVVRTELLRLYGVGPASVQYILTDVFHQPDAFDMISPWEQKIYSRLLFGAELVPARRILRAIKQRWGHWRMLASHYLFEDLFWQRTDRPIDWLEPLIRA